MSSYRRASGDSDGTRARSPRYAARIIGRTGRLSTASGAGARGEMSEGLKEHAWKACVGVILLPWVRIPLSPPHSAFAPCGGGEWDSGAPRLSPLRARIPVSRGVGFRRSAALAASGTNPGFSGSGIQALRGSRRFGHESRFLGEWDSGAPRLSPLRARIPVSRGVGFRRSAAHASPGSHTVDRTPRAAYTGVSARGDGSRRGSEPVQFQPTNRVRAGRQQR